MLDSEFDTLVTWVGPRRVLRGGIGVVEPGKNKQLPKQVADHFASLKLCVLVNEDAANAEKAPTKLSNHSENEEG